MVVSFYSILSYRQPRVSEIIPHPASNSELDVVIHTGNYLSRLKGSSKESETKNVKSFLQFLKDVIENNILGTDERNIQYLHAFSKEIEKYSDLKSSSTRNKIDHLTFLNTFDTLISYDSIFHEGSNGPVNQTHRQWWEFASKALSLSEMSRLVTQISLFNDGKKDRSQPSHLVVGRCMWNPYGPPDPNCMGGDQSGLEEVNKEDPPVPSDDPSNASHLLLAEFSKRFPELLENAHLSHDITSHPEILINLFQERGNDAVATSLFLDKTQTTQFRSTLMKCFELVRLSSQFDTVDHLFARHLELFARHFDDPSPIKRKIPNEQVFKIANLVWPL